MEKRTYTCKVRLREGEHELFKQKASSYHSMSSMIRDAVQVFNPVETKGQMSVILDVSKTIKDATLEVNRIGNNINQIAHVLNYLMLQGDRAGAATFYSQNSAEITSVFAEMMKKIEAINFSERKIFKQLLRR